MWNIVKHVSDMDVEFAADLMKWVEDTPEVEAPDMVPDTSSCDTLLESSTVSLFHFLICIPTEYIFARTWNLLYIFRKHGEHSVSRLLAAAFTEETTFVLSE
jgi:hypothetical protein